MKHLFILLFSISIYSGGIKAKDPVLELRDNISLINIKISSGIIPGQDDFSRIRAPLENNSIFEDYKIDEEKLASIKELSEQFSLFEKLCASNESIDTCLNVLKSFRMKFNTIFGSTALNRILESQKLKILLFSTSMSCECTLKACSRQEDEIQKLYKEYSGRFEYGVLDGYAEHELMTKYSVAFLPTVIVLDERNSEIKIYELGESVYDKLSILLNAYKRE